MHHFVYMALQRQVVEADVLKGRGEHVSSEWTRDPFDRLIVAHAAANDARLLTKDEKIRRHYKRAVW